jgi:uncharacterized membrane protein YdbT with pleckstrin-like domain
VGERAPRRRWFTRPGELAEQYVTDDELIYFDGAPDLRAWIWTQWLELAVMVSVVVIMLAARETRVTVLGLMGEIWLLATLGWRLADQAYTRYVLTDHRALRVSGVLRRDYEWISWKKVTDVSVHRSLFDRWFGTATIQIQSANEMSKFKAMDDVPNPVSFAETIVDLVNGAR